MRHISASISSLSNHRGSRLRHYTANLCKYAYSSILTCHSCGIHHLRILAAVFHPPSVTPIIGLVCVTSRFGSHLYFWSSVHYMRLLKFSCPFQTHPRLPLLVVQPEAPLQAAKNNSHTFTDTRHPLGATCSPELSKTLHLYHLYGLRSTTRCAGTLSLQRLHSR
jgi:hypothetical protein